LLINKNYNLEREVKLQVTGRSPLRRRRSLFDRSAAKMKKKKKNITEGGR